MCIRDRTYLLPEKLQEHVKLNASRLDTFQKVVNEAASYIMSTRTWSQDQDGGSTMVVDAVSKGKGKGKG